MSEHPPVMPRAARLTTLVGRAHAETGAHRAGLAGDINALLEALPSEANPEEVSPVLYRLLQEGQLDGMVDERGRPTSVAATRALLALGYPHALQVAPERLEALRLAANLCAFLLLLFSTLNREVRTRARQAFFWLGALGLLAWLSRLPLDRPSAWGTLASAVGSLLAG